MRKTFLLCILSLYLFACGQAGSNENIAKSDSTQQTIPNSVANDPLAEEQLKSKLIGDWISHHEALAYRFLLDDTYQICDIENGGEINKKASQTGKWEIKDSMMIMNGEEAYLIKIQFFGEVMIMGDTPDQTSLKEEGFQNVEEWVNEFGFSKYVPKK
jgi:hypothetical protein